MSTATIPQPTPTATATPKMTTDQVIAALDAHARVTRSTLYKRVERLLKRLRRQRRKADQQGDDAWYVLTVLWSHNNCVEGSPEQEKWRAAVDETKRLDPIIDRAYALWKRLYFSNVAYFVNGQTSPSGVNGDTCLDQGPFPLPLP